MLAFIFVSHRDNLTGTTIDLTIFQGLIMPGNLVYFAMGIVVTKCAPSRFALTNPLLTYILLTVYANSVLALYVWLVLSSLPLEVNLIRSYSSTTEG